MPEKFEVIVLGVIASNGKVLIVKRKPDRYVKALTWAFPGGRPEIGEELEEAVEREIKEETGLVVEAERVIHAKTYPEKRDLLAVYFLCRLKGGDGRLSNEIEEMKWVKPEELEDYFTTSFHPKLKEMMVELLGQENF